jgi:hypothetical protein
MNKLVGYIIGFALSIHTAFIEKSFRAGSECWKGWKETLSFVHKDDVFMESRQRRDDKIVKNSLELLNDMEKNQQK